MSCSRRNHRFIKLSKFQNPADLPSPKKCLLWAMFPKNRWPILQQKSTIWIMDTWETNGFYMVCKAWKGWNMPHFVDDWPLQEMVMFQFANCAMTRGRAPIFLGFPLGITIKSYNITISITILPHVSCFFPTSMVKTNGELPPWSPLLGRYASIVPASADLSCSALQKGGRESLENTGTCVREYTLWLWLTLLWAIIIFNR